MPLLVTFGARGTIETTGAVGSSTACSAYGTTGRVRVTMDASCAHEGSKRLAGYVAVLVTFDKALHPLGTGLQHVVLHSLQVFESKEVN